jgi:hypothetical protein
MLVSGWALARITVGAAFVALSTVLTALAIIPTGWPAWVIVLVGSSAVFALFVYSEYKRADDRRLVTDDHRVQLHAEAEFQAENVGRLREIALPDTEIRASFRIHFPNDARLLDQFSKARAESNTAKDALGQRIANPGVAILQYRPGDGMHQLIESVVNGLDPATLLWDSKHHDGKPPMAEVSAASGNMTYGWYWPASEAATRKAEMISALAGIATWPEIGALIQAQKHENQAVPGILRRLERIRGSYEIRRARGCVFCSPYKS